MSQVKFFRNMESVVPATGAAEGLYFNQYGIGLSDGTTTTDVSSVIAFNEDKDRFFHYTATNGGKALFGTAGGHCVHVQHNDYERINNFAYSNYCKNSPAIASQTYSDGTLKGLRRGLYVLTLFTKNTDIVTDETWSVGYTSISTFINIVFPNCKAETWENNPYRPCLEDMYDGYPNGNSYDTGFPNMDLFDHAYTSSGAWVFYSLPFSMFGRLCVARVELGTPANAGVSPGNITNALVFPFGSYKKYGEGDDSDPTPVKILDASNGSVISTNIDGYMFLDRFEVC